MFYQKNDMIHIWNIKQRFRYDFETNTGFDFLQIIKSK